MMILQRIGGLFIALTCFAAAAFAAFEVPAVGSPAPQFSLPDQNGNQTRLSDWRGRWVVLYFYPKDDTPGCTEEACHFRDDLQALKALGAQVVGISVDNTTSHAAFAKKYNLPFPLLADADASVAKRFGAYSDWLVTGFAKRYTFLIDPSGRIVQSYLNVDTSRHSTEIIADLKRLSSGTAK
jgi:peroxiredoxin Q/BCP